MAVLTLHVDTGLGTLLAEALTSMKPQPCPQVIEWVGVQGWSKWASIGYEALFFVVLSAATLVAMHLVRHDRR